MENLSAETIKKALECCIKAVSLYDCEKMGCPALTKNGCQFYLRTDNDNENALYVEMLKDALALITSQEQRIKELEAENRQYHYDQRKLVEAHDTYKEYAENMQLFVEKIVHLEDKGYEPSAARYAAEMDMWRAVALEKKRLTEERDGFENLAHTAIETQNRMSDTIEELTEENEGLRNRITCQVVLPDEKLEEIKNECLERVELDIKKIEADTVRKMQERLKAASHIESTITGYRYSVVDVVEIDQIAEELLEGE